MFFFFPSIHFGCSIKKEETMEIIISSHRVALSLLLERASRSSGGQLEFRNLFLSVVLHSKRPAGEFPHREPSSYTTAQYTHSITLAFLVYSQKKREKEMSHHSSLEKRKEKRWELPYICGGSSEKRTRTPKTTRGHHLFFSIPGIYHGREVE